MSIEWWSKGIPYGKVQPKIEQILDRATPKPGRAQNHLLGYGKDDWELIEAVREGKVDPQTTTAFYTCQGCTVKVKAVVSRVITDNASRWLCPDCLDNGFIWASHVLPSQYYQYQIVKENPDDTLMRRLDRGPKSYERDPFDPASQRRISISVPESDLHKDPYDQGGGSAGGTQVPERERLGDGPKDSGDSHPEAGGADALPDGDLNRDAPGGGGSGPAPERASP